MSPIVIVLSIALAAIGFWAAGRIRKLRRRWRLRSQPLPLEWRAVVERFLPSYRFMPKELRPLLDGLIQQFLAEKEFVGCDGLEVTVEMKVAIAAQACLLVVMRPADYLYDRLYSILLYPDAFLVPKEEHDAAGVVTRHQEVLTGEAWETHRIVLSWEDVQASLKEPDYNVVLHEFAHYLDAADGEVNGAPRLNNAVDHRRWATVMSEAYEKLRAAVERGEDAFLDPYATENPAEFFAVITESFFGRPLQFQHHHPALYAELKRYYQLDPAFWMGKEHPR